MVPSALDKLMAAGRGTVATAAPPTAAPSAPAAVAPAPAAVVNTTPAPAVAVPPPAARVVPPWANAACNSCKGSGFNMKTGQPCFPCSSMAEARKDGSDPSKFTVQIVDGIVLWRNDQGNVRGDMKLEGYVAPKLETREAAPVEPARTVVQVAQPSLLGKLAAAAGTAPTVAPATAPVAAPAAPAAAPTGEPIKRGRGRPKKSVTLPPVPAGTVPTLTVSPEAQKTIDAVAAALPSAQGQALTTETVTSGASTVPTRDEASLTAAVDKPVTYEGPINPQRAGGFIIIIGSVQIGGVGVGQVASRDLSAIIRDRLAPQVEQVLTKTWWSMPVYERRDALVQRAQQISTTLSGIITVDQNDSEAMPLARALIPFSDGAFIANR